MTMKHHEGGDPLTFTYNAFGQITTLQDGATRVTYTYDDNGNQTAENCD